MGASCLLLAGDIGDEHFCQEVISKAIQTFGKIDILVNNAAEQHPQKVLRISRLNSLPVRFKRIFFNFPFDQSCIASFKTRKRYY